ncbi:hypothetical protein ACJ73_02472 [Blastomyces percursus]|uniref:Uncharacterized protein n=1 Tax=Blastomyces percursus TaxID=1658174 RepID=A0A1J9QDI5_9EURO|nr:hypothetical protein ACJ73_02472 [Blastomyces percursus]
MECKPELVSSEPPEFPSVDGPFISVRLCWPPSRERVRKLNTPEEEHNALEDYIGDNGFRLEDVSAIVPLSKRQYDVAVHERVLAKFQSVTSHLKVQPFSEYDSLSINHGEGPAAAIAVEKYEAELQKGVIPGTKEWFEAQISMYKTYGSSHATPQISLSEIDDDATPTVKLLH